MPMKPSSLNRPSATLSVRPLAAVTTVRVPPRRDAVDFGYDRPSADEYIAWRLHVLQSPDYEGDRSGDVLPSGAEIRALLRGSRRH